MQAINRFEQLPLYARIPVYVMTGAVLGTAFFLVLGLPTMLLWNALMPDLLNLPPLHYWQAVGL